MDIESYARSGMPFSQNLFTTRFSGAHDAVYYRACELYLDWNPWPNDREREAWSLHAAGHSHREIRKELRCRDSWLVATLKKHRERMKANLHRLAG